MRIHIATDHAGLDFSTQLQEHLRAAGHEVVDHGPGEYDALDDYPSFCINAALGVARDERDGVEALGVVFGVKACGLGFGNLGRFAFNRIGGGFAPFGQIIVGILGADLHGATVNRLFKAFGQLHLGGAAALADDHLSGDVAPIDHDDLCHKTIPQIACRPCRVPSATEGVGFRHGACCLRPVTCQAG